MRFGRSGLGIGGFRTVEFDRPEGGPYDLARDCINFLILYEPIERFRIFSELEIGSLFALEEGEGSEFGSSITVERL